jgi:hypothetical protein
MQVAIKHDESKDDHVFLSKMKESGLVIKSKRENVSSLDICSCVRLDSWDQANPLIYLAITSWL